MTPPFQNIEVGTELGRGWELFLKNISLLVVAGLAAMALSAVTCGLLTGPMAAGMYGIVNQLLDPNAPKPATGDLFKGFDFFLQTLLLMVIVFFISLALALIPLIGQLAAFLMGSAFSWCMLFVVMEGRTATDSIKHLFNLLGEGRFTTPFFYGALVSLLSSIGFLACGIGLLVTVPLGYCMMVGAYRTLFGDPAFQKMGTSDTPPLSV